MCVSATTMTIPGQRKFRGPAEVSKFHHFITNMLLLLTNSCALQILLFKFWDENLQNLQQGPPNPLCVLLALYCQYLRIILQILVHYIANSYALYCKYIIESAEDPCSRVPSSLVCIANMFALCCQYLRIILQMLLHHNSILLIFVLSPSFVDLQKIPAAGSPPPLCVIKLLSRPLCRRMPAAVRTPVNCILYILQWTTQYILYIVQTLHILRPVRYIPQWTAYSTRCSTYSRTYSSGLQILHVHTEVPFLPCRLLQYKDTVTHIQCFNTNTNTNTNCVECF